MAVYTPRSPHFLASGTPYVPGGNPPIDPYPNIVYLMSSDNFLLMSSDGYYLSAYE